MVSIELHVKRVNRVSVQHGLPNQACTDQVFT